VQLLAQVVQNSGGAALALGFDDAAVEHKAHGVGDLGHGEGVRINKRKAPILKNRGLVGRVWRRINWDLTPID